MQRKSFSGTQKNFLLEKIKPIMRWRGLLVKI